MAGRFSFSAPESRYGGPPWFRIGQLDVTTTVLVALACVGSMFVYAILGDLDPLILWPEKVLEGQLWRLVTWPIANGPDIWTLLTIVIFWYFGREVEGLVGRNRFAWFLLALTVIPGIVGTIIDLPQAGIRPIEIAVFLVFVAEYPYVRFFFGIPGWVLGAVFLGLEILQLLGERNERGIIFLFVTLAVAAIGARTMGLAESFPWIPRIPLPSNSGSARRSKKQRSVSSGSTVVEGPWSPPASPPSVDAVAAQAELDMLLDKISATGLDSLSAAEKRRLNELSKKLR
ncbi:MAG: rhomboid family intramembrane serine protease [Ilumatobacteraceae bacterium]|nr:rhomboid family intramembrane serine protease [Ilumatobacteraceae bacterium]